MPPLKYHFDESPCQMGWLWHHLPDYNDYKIKDIQMHIMHEQRGWVVWCPHVLHKVEHLQPYIITKTNTMVELLHSCNTWNMTPFDTKLKVFAMSNWKTT